MGGNALPLANCRRHDRKEFETTGIEIIKRIYSSVLYKYGVINSDLFPTSYCADKETFGDADILYSTVNNEPLDVENFKVIFNPTQIIRNGSVISFDFNDLQIDMIHCKNEWVDYAFCYHGNYDIGNFIGKLARYYGLSHGHDGLFLPLRDEGGMFDKILLTRDHDLTLQFLGLDASVFNQGFDSAEDIFKFVASSPAYSPEWYKLENVSSIGRIRDRKRDSYRKFLEFGEKQTGPFPEKVKDKSIFFGDIFDFFTGSREQFRNSIAKLSMYTIARGKFNGDIVKDLTGLENKELGEFMKHLKADIRFAPDMIVYTQKHTIDQNILYKYKQFVL